MTSISSSTYSPEGQLRTRSTGANLLVPALQPKFGDVYVAYFLSQSVRHSVSFLAFLKYLVEKHATRRLRDKRRIRDGVGVNRDDLVDPACVLRTSSKNRGGGGGRVTTCFQEYGSTAFLEGGRSKKAFRQTSPSHCHFERRSGHCLADWPLCRVFATGTNSFCTWKR